MELLKVGDFLKWEPDYPDPIIAEGIMYPRSRIMMYGKKDTLKSMLAINLGSCLASGFPWANFQTGGEQKVAYIQSEIPRMLLHKRLNKVVGAWKAKNGNAREVEENLLVSYTPYLKLDTARGVKELTEKLEEEKPAIVIIDPLYKTLSGNILDPNSARLFVDEMDRLIDKYVFSLVIIHHTRKGSLDEQPGDFDASDDMLGSIVFSWWADTIIKIVRKGGSGREESVSLKFDKVRHAEDIVQDREVIFNRDTLLFTPSDKVLL